MLLLSSCSGFVGTVACMSLLERAKLGMLVEEEVSPGGFHYEMGKETEEGGS